MSYDLSTHDFSNPDPWVALALDRSTAIETSASEALMRNNGTWSRRRLLPLIRPVARLCIVFAQLLRILLPNTLTAPRFLHRVIVFGMKYVVSPDANYLIFRHFHIGSQVLKFIGDNVPGVQIRAHPLSPWNIDDFAPNTFVQHDLNIYNFIIQLNAQLRDQGREIGPRALGEMDFSAIIDFDDRLPAMPHRWHNFLDLQSAIELYTPLFGILLSHADFNRSSNSLQLDETIAIYVARLFDRESLVGLVNNRHPAVPFSTWEAGFRLMLHGIDAENLYGLIKSARSRAQAAATTNAAPTLTHDER